MDMEEEMATDAELLDRITVRPDVFGGKPIIRDMRIAVEHVLGMLAAGDTTDTILMEYPRLEAEDLQACLVLARRTDGAVATREGRADLLSRANKRLNHCGSRREA